MFECEMTGCFDTAEYVAEFEADEEQGPKNVFDVCESCANYWKNHAEENPKITLLAIYEKAGQR